MGSGTKNQQELCDAIFALDESVRFAGVIDKMGNLVAGGMKKGLQPLEPKEERRKLYLDFAFRHAMRQDFDPEFGRVIYTLSEREKIKIASFPLGEKLLLISIDKVGDHADIINRVMELIGSD